MTYRIHVSETARSQILSVLQFASKVSLNYAINLRNDINKAISSLESMPKRFPVIEECETVFGEFRKLVVNKYFVLVFRIDKENVFVDYLLDVRKDDYKDII